MARKLTKKQQQILDEVLGKTAAPPVELSREEARNRVTRLRMQRQAQTDAPTIPDFAEQAGARGLEFGLGTALEGTTAPPTATGVRRERISPDIQKDRAEQGFFERAGEDIKERASTIGETFKKGFTEVSPLKAAGQVAGAVTDVVGEGLVSLFRGISAITPDQIEDPIKRKAAEVLQTDTGQAALEAIGQGAETYQGFKEKNPLAAETLEAVVNIGALLPIGRAKAAVPKKGPSPLRRAAEGLEEAAETTIEAERGAFIRDLVRPVQTKKVREAQVGRTTEVGRGAARRSIIEPTTRELRAEEAIAKFVPEVSKKNTFQQNFNLIKDANTREAENLKRLIAENDVAITRAEIDDALVAAKARLAESPVLVGDAEKTANRILAKAEQLISESDETASGLLQVRKDLDSFIKAQKGPKAFDLTKENAFNIANREIRGAINDLIDSKLVDVDVKESFRSQSALFNAMENITPKAAKEADTAIKRVIQKMETALGTRDKVVQTLAVLTGIGIFGAAQKFALPFTVGASAVLFALKAKKVVFGPALKKSLSKALVAIDDILETTLEPAVRQQLLIEKAAIEEVLERGSLEEDS